MRCLATFPCCLSLSLSLWPVLECSCSPQAEKARQLNKETRSIEDESVEGAKMQMQSLCDILPNKRNSLKISPRYAVANRRWRPMAQRESPSSIEYPLSSWRRPLLWTSLSKQQIKIPLTGTFITWGKKRMTEHKILTFLHSIHNCSPIHLTLYLSNSTVHQHRSLVCHQNWERNSGAQRVSELWW